MSHDVTVTMPLMKHLGITVTAAGPGEVTGSMAWRMELCTTVGVMHGGALMAFADSLGSLCAQLNLPEGGTTSAIESKTNFFRPVTTGAVYGTATPVHIGRTTIVVQTDVRDGNGERVALVTQTQAVTPPRM